jgi:hypothetical protein
MKEYLHCKGRKIQPTPANSARGEKYNQPPPIQPGEETRDQTQKRKKEEKRKNPTTRNPSEQSPGAHREAGPTRSVHVEPKTSRFSNLEL